MNTVHGCIKTTTEYSLRACIHYTIVIQLYNECIVLHQSSYTHQFLLIQNQISLIIYQYISLTTSKSVYTYAQFWAHEMMQFRRAA